VAVAVAVAVDVSGGLSFSGGLPGGLSGGLAVVVSGDLGGSGVACSPPPFPPTDYDPYVAPKCPIIVSVTCGTNPGDKG
jgi:hypothetical protein